MIKYKPTFEKHSSEKLFIHASNDTEFKYQGDHMATHFLQVLQ